MTFGLSGGAFALPFVVATSLDRPPTGGGLSQPSGLELVPVAGGLLGGALVSRLLWTRLGGPDRHSGGRSSAR